jgi:putative oxidoreductase
MNLRNAYPRFASAANYLQAPLLLVIRLYWGWQFFQTGWGKLTHLSRTGGYFSSLHIPFPQFSAGAAGTVECLGGLLLLAGLFSRFASLALVVILSVAYATAESEALGMLFSDPDKFTGATPFLFLFACLVILAFGPGPLSADRFIFGNESRGGPSRKG